VPIVAGIMPITNLSQIKRFTALCGACIPTQLLARSKPPAPIPSRARDRRGTRRPHSAADLLARGAPGIHFYTLNRSLATRHVLEQLRS
jgi:methylenetetrahydrofolate reductase (NADPH)